MNNLINLTQQSNLVLTFLQTFHVFKIGHKKVKGKNLSHEIILMLDQLTKLSLRYHNFNHGFMSTVIDMTLLV